MTKAKAYARRIPAVLDIETRVTSDHHQSLRVWLRLLACSSLIGNHVRQRLQSQFGITLPRFDLMAQLERAPEGLKMGELTRRLMVTGGNVTGITDALEAEGLVLRETDPTDQRAFRVKLTKAGEQQFRRMAIEHERWVVELFEDLTAKQKTLLADLLKSLKASAALRLLAGGGPRT
ncbi:MAG TPA: MarR family transcriptional regulator [Steroidobacteraceae bacterium]|jgi:DNA-binding MarR family transcriptional regulator